MNQPKTAPDAQGLSYRDAGVDIDAGDALVERIKPFAKRTMREGVLAGIGGFGALFEVPKRYKEPVLVSGTDGVGTKLKLAFELNMHDTVGIDLVAMSVNDILVQGAEPLFFLDYFACGKLDVSGRDRRRQGHRARLRAGRLRADRRRDGGNAGHVPGRRIRPGRLRRRRGGKERRSSTARTIAPGDVVLGLASSGAHSNGYSLVRKIIDGGEARPATPISTAAPLADALMEPTRIYVKPLLALMQRWRSRAWRTSPAAAWWRTSRACCPTALTARARHRSVDAAAAVRLAAAAWRRRRRRDAPRVQLRHRHGGDRVRLKMSSGDGAAVGGRRAGLDDRYGAREPGRRGADGGDLRRCFAR